MNLSEKSESSLLMFRVPKVITSASWGGAPKVKGLAFDFLRNPNPPRRCSGSEGRDIRVVGRSPEVEDLAFDFLRNPNPRCRCSGSEGRDIRVVGRSPEGPRRRSGPEGHNVCVVGRSPEGQRSGVRLSQKFESSSSVFGSEGRDIRVVGRSPEGPEDLAFDF